MSVSPRRSPATTRASHGKSKRASVSPRDRVARTSTASPDHTSRSRSSSTGAGAEPSPRFGSERKTTFCSGLDAGLQRRRIVGEQEDDRLGFLEAQQVAPGDPDRPRPHPAFLRPCGERRRRDRRRRRNGRRIVRGRVRSHDSALPRIRAARRGFAGRPSAAKGASPGPCAASPSGAAAGRRDFVAGTCATVDDKSLSESLSAAGKRRPELSLEMCLRRARAKSRPRRPRRAPFRA